MVRKNRWASTSEWQSIMVVTPTGQIEELKPETPIYFTNKKETFTRTVDDLLQMLFKMGVDAQIPDPWHYAVKCISSMCIVKQMKIYDPTTHKLVGKASLTPPRKLMH